MLTAAVMALVAGCGSGSRTPQLASLPLPPGAKLERNLRRCNGGSNAYCGLVLVVVDPKYKSSWALVRAERRELRGEGWIGASPDTGIELADESPHHTLRVTYATAVDDLQGIDLGWINRPGTVVSALDTALFTRTAAMSVLLEVGSQ